MLRNLDHAPFARRFFTQQTHAQHQCPDGAADEAIEPVIVGVFGTDFPLLDRAAAALGCHLVLGRQVLGEQATSTDHEPQK